MTNNEITSRSLIHCDGAAASWRTPIPCGRVAACSVGIPSA